MSAYQAIFSGEPLNLDAGKLSRDVSSRRPENKLKKWKQVAPKLQEVSNLLHVVSRRLSRLSLLQERQERQSHMRYLSIEEASYFCVRGAHRVAVHPFAGFD